MACELNDIHEGDTLQWIGNCGEVRGVVRKCFGDRLCAFIDDNHCLMVESICHCPGTTIIKKPETK